MLNKNKSLTGLQAENLFVSNFKVYPFELDDYQLRHSARFIEITAKEYFIGGLGFTSYHGVFDLSNKTFHSLKIQVANPTERFKKSVLSSRDLISDILVEQQLDKLDVPYTIANVFKDERGLYFDLNIETESKLVTIKIDHRFDSKATRVILLE